MVPGSPNSNLPLTLVCPSQPGDPQTENFWYGALAALNSAIPHAGQELTPPGLYGPWVTQDNPGWHGDFTIGACTPLVGRFVCELSLHVDFGFSFNYFILLIVVVIIVTHCWCRLQLRSHFLRSHEQQSPGAYAFLSVANAGLYPQGDSSCVTASSDWLPLLTVGACSLGVCPPCRPTRRPSPGRCSATRVQDCISPT